MSPIDRNRRLDKGGSRPVLSVARLVTLVTIVLFVVLVVVLAFTYKVYADDAFTNHLADSVISWLQGQKRITADEISYTLQDVHVVVSQKSEVNFSVEKSESHTIFGLQLPKELWGATFRNSGKAFVFAGVDLKSTPYTFKVKGDSIVVTIPHAKVLVDQSSIRESHTQVEINGVLNRIGDAFGNGGQNAIDVKEELDRQALRTAIAQCAPGLLMRADRQLEKEVVDHLKKLGFQSVTVLWDGSTEPLD